MDAQHASRGRRMLEEIRQKRAAERVQKAPSGSESENSYIYEMPSYDGGGRYSEKDYNALLNRLKEMEKKNTVLETENIQVQSKLEASQAENETLLKRVNLMEHETLPSLRKSLQGLSIEKDTAVVAREDLLTQVRTLKRRLKVAEEEQYRAEEDAAALRAELNSMQQQEMRNNYNNIASMDRSADLIKSMETENLGLKSQLQNEIVKNQEALQRLAEEQAKTSSLLAQKQELEQQLSDLSKASEELSRDVASKTVSVQEKEKLEKQLHDLAVMVERLENGRQKLLLEIDSQSSQIEKLYEENADLSASYNDALKAIVEWENQVKSCLEQNKELRETLQKLRSDKSSSLNPQGSEALQQLKDQLAEEESRSEALSAEVLRLSTELKQSAQSYQRLTWMYRPVLRNIEEGLMKMKQESFVSV